MTPEELDALEAVADAATAGPWFTEQMDLYCSIEVKGQKGGPSRYVTGRLLHPDGYGVVTVNDAAFIVAARSGVPALIAALREAWADRDQARSLVTAQNQERG